MESDQKRKVIFSGIQPTGVPHLGNYLGAIKNWSTLQEQFNCIYSIVNMHSITLRQDSTKLRQNSRDMLTLLLACKIDPDKSIVYYQSSVPAHAELSWILCCYTYLGELNRMTQFKDKSIKNESNINAGLFTYPVLMAADILLYQADLVPVGDDQKQHLELSRDLAERFNNIYGNVFTIPDPYINKIGARIMGLQNPTRKMSKSESDNENNIVYITDTKDVIIKKLKRAVTDSDNFIKYSDEKPGIKNLLDIYITITGKTIEQSEKIFEGVGYGEFKETVGLVIAQELSDIQLKYNELKKDKNYIDNIIKQSEDKANYIANKTLKKVQKKVGFPV